MKRVQYLCALGALLLVAGCSSPPPARFSNVNASGHVSGEIISCVPYARQISGVKLYGDADSWWDQARVRYLRGNKPQPNAVLVLRKTSRMKSGHVAVVQAVLGPRLISVAHSNWGSDSASRHIIYTAMKAEDVSKRNDWTSVRFWNNAKNTMGFPYAAYGFIYP